MERSAIERLRAVIALMVGAFTFGVYLSGFQAQMNAVHIARQADANRVAGLIMENASIKNSLLETKEKLIHIEAIILNWGR